MVEALFVLRCTTAPMSAQTSSPTLSRVQPLPTATTEFGVVDLMLAARASGRYKKLDKTAWPSRQPPRGKHQRGGVLLSLRNAATYEMGLAAAAEAAPARTPACKPRRGKK